MPAPVRESRLTAEHPPALRPDLDAALWKRHCGRPKPSDTQVAHIVEKCKQDPEFFIFEGFARTFDEHADPDSRVKGFPDKSYLRRVIRFWHEDDPDHPVRANVKSRQIMFSWLACAYGVWEAHFHDFSRVMVQSRRAEDAWAFVYKRDWVHGRCGFIERALPMELRAAGLTGTRGSLNYPWGSEIWGIPEGGDVPRSHTATLFICDEAAFQPAFRDAYAAVLPMAKKIIVLSTALGGSFFGDLVEQNEKAEFEAA